MNLDTCVYVCIMLYVFFFKQKTAYEMRISDWSSDVCSSDLSKAVVPGLVPGTQCPDRSNGRGSPCGWLGYKRCRASPFASANRSREQVPGRQWCVFPIAVARRTERCVNPVGPEPIVGDLPPGNDRKRTRLNSSH